MHSQAARTGTATAMAILLLGVGLAGTWWAVAPAILGGNATPYQPAAPQPYEAAEVAAAPLLEGVRIASSIQVSQPRDPFRPLISEDSGVLGGPGGGNQALGLTIELVSVNENGTSADVLINGVTYTVAPGDVFAGQFQVIALFPPEEGVSDGSGVFLFGDNAFELGVGQQILK